MALALALALASGLALGLIAAGVVPAAASPPDRPPHRSAQTAGGAHVVLPLRCSVVGGRVRLMPAQPSHEAGSGSGGARTAAVRHAIASQREVAPMRICGAREGAECRITMLHRFQVLCGGARVPWIEIAAQLMSGGPARVTIQRGSLTIAVPPPAAAQTAVAWDPDGTRAACVGAGHRPVAPFHLGHRVASRSDCAAVSDPLPATAEPQIITLPAGFAPVAELGARLEAPGETAPSAALGSGQMARVRTAPARDGGRDVETAPLPDVAPRLRETAEGAAAASLDPVARDETDAAGSVSATLAPVQAPTADIRVAAAPVAAPEQAATPQRAAETPGATAGHLLPAALPTPAGLPPRSDTAPPPMLRLAESAPPPRFAGPPMRDPAPHAVPPDWRPPSTSAPAATMPARETPEAIVARLARHLVPDLPPLPDQQIALLTLLGAAAGLFVTGSSLAWLARSRRRRPVRAMRVAPQPPQLLDGAHTADGTAQIEALCAQADLAVDALAAAPPLQEVLDGEVRLARQRLATVSEALQAGGEAARRAPAVCRNIVRDLDRVMRIAASAAASFHVGSQGGPRALAPPATCAEAYALLGVNAEAGDTIVKKLADALRMCWHPDHARDDTDRAMREARTKQINIAVDMIRHARAETARLRGASAAPDTYANDAETPPAQRRRA